MEIVNSEEEIKVTIEISYRTWKATEVGGKKRLFYVLKQSRMLRTKYSMVPRKVKTGVEYVASIAVRWDEPREGYYGQIRLYPM